MKIFPKNVYVWINVGGQPEVTLLPERIAAGQEVGIYELRAIKVVKRETVLEDPPPTAEEEL